MGNAKRPKNSIVFKLRKSYREGKLDTSQVARLKAIGVDFDGAVFIASKDSLAGQYPAIAAMSISVRIPRCSSCFAILFHSFFASSSSHAGQRGAFFSDFGSPVLRLLLPGLPSSTFTAVGFGFLPLCATVLTSS